MSRLTGGRSAGPSGAAASDDEKEPEAVTAAEEILDRAEAAGGPATAVTRKVPAAVGRVAGMALGRKVLLRAAALAGAAGAATTVVWAVVARRRPRRGRLRLRLH